MSCPANLNLCFFQGTTWQIPFRITNDGEPVSLSGATITASLRENIDDAAAAANFSCSVVDGPDGQGQAVLAAATTLALAYDTSPDGERNPTFFFYDIKIQLAGGTVIAPLSGQITAYPAATR